MFGKLINILKENPKKIVFTEGSDPYPAGTEKQFSFPTPPRRAKRGRPPVMSDSEINKLAAKVAYLSQELEFLKKIILAEHREK